MEYYIDDFPRKHGCVCGSKSNMAFKDISTNYSGQSIMIKNVPIYKCDNGHIKLSRITRVKIRELLKYAWENDLTIVYYGEYKYKI